MHSVMQGGEMRGHAWKIVPRMRGKLGQVPDGSERSFRSERKDFPGMRIVLVDIALIISRIRKVSEPLRMRSHEGAGRCAPHWNSDCRERNALAEHPSCSGILDIANRLKFHLFPNIAHGQNCLVCRKEGGCTGFGNRGLEIQN